jgi:hypothetical protein
MSMPSGDDAEASLRVVALLSNRGGFVTRRALFEVRNPRARDLGRGRKSPVVALRVRSDVWTVRCFMPAV